MFNRRFRLDALGALLSIALAIGVAWIHDRNVEVSAQSHTW
jgi:hypothetical protein